MTTRSVKGRADHLKLGSWNAICDRCGAKFKAEDLQRDWQGFMCCREDYEARHPQDFVRGVADPNPVPWARPRSTAVFTGVCSPTGQTALPDAAVADCAVADFISPSFDPSIF